MPLKLQVRRDTASNWAAVNPLLLQGELAFETDTYRLKIGDGVTYWNDLSYYNTYSNNILTIASYITVGNSTVNAYINSTSITVGNTLTNTTVNSSMIIVGNASINAVINSTAISFSNGTYIGTINAAAFDGSSNTDGGVF